MQIIIPMAGSGARFVRAGYSTLKSLIEVDGRPMIEHVVRMFPDEHDFLFICARPHLEETPLRSVLESLVPKATIVAIEPHKGGPVCTVLAANDFIKDDEPVVLNYCDAAALWDYADFKQRMEQLDCAGSLVAFRGFHPHSLGSTLYAYIREQNNTLLEIREKRAFTDQRMNEYASTGTYYFRSGALLKHYLQRAVERDLQTHGEYFASVPYNLLVEDGLQVHVYEVKQFTHWGTPEDLAEYQAWSNYFAQYVHWKPTMPVLPGINLIPMAGAGARFSQEGYPQPKPLVPIAGAPMVQRSLDTFPPAQTWIAACRAEHLQLSALEPVLTSNGHRVQILPVDRLTEGQACTCLLARPWLDPNAPLLIAPCDAALIYDQEQYADLTTNPEVDCLVWTFRNHPHANRHPHQYGWVEATPEGNIQRISCKVPLNDDVRRDPGIIGAFWFRQARFFLEAAEALIAQNRRVNHEFYVDSAIEVLLEQNRRAKLFDVQHYICFGTPDDVRSYEYWAAYFHQASHHPYQNDRRPEPKAPYGLTADRRGKTPSLAVNGRGSAVA
jgi:bifunctional N-acetylglucosamine-1-phosphate-uridyltransferase/glucosamine-1-phosphate-acetyltransferase GlmU-like protein